MYNALNSELEAYGLIDGGDAASVRRAFKYFAIDYQLDARCRPAGQYAGPVTLFNVRGNSRSAVDWKPFVSTTPEIYEFDVKGTKGQPNAHNAMLAEENARPIALWLNTLLEDVSPRTH